MKRVTVSLPEDLARLLAHEARRRSTSVSEVIRQAVYASLPGFGRQRVGFAAICKDPNLCSGEDLEATLDREWIDDLEPSRR